MISSPNVIYPQGTTYVYQGGQQIGSWTHVGPYEVAPAVVGDSVRQAALYNEGTTYSLAGIPAGAPLPTVANTYDAASDGTWIYGWNVVAATLSRYDLNWNLQQALFSLGSSYSYAFMGITYDPQNSSIWLSPLSTGSIETKGYLYNYSMDGQLLGKLPLANPLSVGNGLAYDPADNTLWFFNSMDQRYEQYSRNGQLLNTMTGMTRIFGAEFQMVPEPSGLILFWIAVSVILGVSKSKTGASRNQSC